MQLNIKTPSPIFGGSTGGWLRSALEEEKYAITWNTPKEQIFEMPTGGAAIMRIAENLVYFSRKVHHSCHTRERWSRQKGGAMPQVYLGCIKYQRITISAIC
jgi:hypothetical protein